MYQSVSSQLVALNKTQGITLTSQQLENCTAAIMADARSVGMRPVTFMEFAVRDNGQTDTSRVGAYQGNPNHPATNVGITDMAQAVNTPAQQSFEQFDQNTLAMAQQQQMFEQQRMAEQQSQSQGMSMHR